MRNFVEYINGLGIGMSGRIKLRSFIKSVNESGSADVRRSVSAEFDEMDRATKGKRDRHDAVLEYLMNAGYVRELIKIYFWTYCHMLDGKLDRKGAMRAAQKEIETWERTNGSSLLG